LFKQDDFLFRPRVAQFAAKHIRKRRSMNAAADNDYGFAVCHRVKMAQNRA
jgi:hypothetical protein